MPEPRWERPWEGRPLVLQAHRREEPEEPDALRAVPHLGPRELTLKPLARRPGRRATSEA